MILTHTIKGWTLGKDFEARNATHQMKKLTLAELKEFRDRLYLPIPDAALEARRAAAVLPPGPGLRRDPVHEGAAGRARRRAAAPGSARQAAAAAAGLGLRRVPTKGSGKQSVATTMAFVRILKDLMKDPVIGDRFVPIIPDEARTFGMDSLFPTAKIYSPFGQTYEAVDRNLHAVVQGVRARPDPARGHLRGRRDGLGDRGGHLVRHPRHAHDPGVRVLLDVRLAADRRPDVGARRPAGPRLPARGHRRPHHADRRGAAAQRRALACCSPRCPRRASPTTRRGRTRSR